MSDTLPRPDWLRVYGITGRKNAGKTGLTERLIEHFTASGLRVAAIKRAHHATRIDHEGTDSDRMRAAGAAQVVLSSPERVGVMTELRGAEPPGLETLLSQIAPCDLVLIEGFKDAPHPKIEAWRDALPQPPLAPGRNITALATKGTPPDQADGLRRFELDDTAAIADFIAAELGLSGGRKRSSMPPGVDWLPVAEAQARLREALKPLGGAETRRIETARGRVLAEDALARRASPPRPNSAVDGYGVAHGTLDGPAKRAAGRAAAGQPFEGTLAPGEAVRILTGAILPEGVDTVILQEETRIEGDLAHFARIPRRGANTRAAGEDVPEGAIALHAGMRLRAPDIALLAALGVAEIRTRPALRVGVLSTGDEIIADPASPALPHQIWDANRPMLLGLAAAWGAVPVDLGRAEDRPEAIEAALDRGAAEADLILTSGGASTGDEDHVARLLAERGRLSSWRIAMKPGRPLALAFWPSGEGGREVPVIGLPGNPVAALVCALIFAKPAADLLEGAGWTEPRGFIVPAAFRKSKGPGRREYLRARLDDQGRAEAFGSEGSGRISGLSWADGLVELDDPAREIHPGDPVRFIPYASFGAG